MTNDQEKTVLQMYKKGCSYKEIFAETDIPMATAASFMRRKHRSVMRLMEMKKMRDTPKKIKKIQETLNLKEYQAHALFYEMQDRYLNKKMTAKKNGVDFDVLLEDVDFPMICPYLGTPLNYYETNCKADNYPTFDRVDNTKGYVKGNTIVVSWKANRIKSSATAAELRAIADGMDKHVAQHTVCDTLDC